MQMRQMRSCLKTMLGEVGVWSWDRGWGVGLVKWGTGAKGMGEGAEFATG